MAEAKTEPEKNVDVEGISEQKTEDWEKRYKDTQAKLTEAEQEKAELARYLESIQPLLAAVPVQQPAEDDEGYVDKRAIKQMRQEFSQEINALRGITDFRMKYPDMIPYEDIIASYIYKTDPRLPKEQRLEKAVKLTKDFLAEERKKGITATELELKKQQEELELKKRKEAESAGLEAGKVEETKKEERLLSPEEELTAHNRRLAHLKGLL